jgi:HK97 family phage prohead protease
MKTKANVVRKNVLAKIVAKDGADGKPGPVSVVISTGAVDRAGDTIDPEGWVLDNYKQNPVVLYGHDRYSMPIGKSANVRVEDGALKCDIEFAPTATAQECEKLVRGGFVNTVSAGFLPLEYTGRKDEAHPYGIAYTKQELLEVSFVAVPANPEAAIEAREVRDAGAEEQMQAMKACTDASKACAEACSKVVDACNQVIAKLQEDAAEDQAESESGKSVLEQSVKDLAESLKTLRR